MTSHDHDLTSNDFFDLRTSRIDSTIVAKNIGVLHINSENLKEQYYNENMCNHTKTSIFFVDMTVNWPISQSHMSKQVRGQMIVLRLTFIDLWRTSMWQIFAAPDNMTSNDPLLTSHLSVHIFIVLLVSLAFIWYATWLYSSDSQFFNFSRFVNGGQTLWPMIPGQTGLTSPREF